MTDMAVVRFSWHKCGIGACPNKYSKKNNPSQIKCVAVCRHLEDTWSKLLTKAQRSGLRSSVA